MVRFFITVLCLFSLSAHSADKVTATIDQNPVLLGNSFILNITANFGIDEDDWDSGTLNKDFVIGQTSTLNNVSNYNGSFTRTVTLSTLLIARNAGVFIIPAFEFGNSKTQPIKLTVIDAGKQNNKTSSANTQINSQQNIQQNIELKNSLSTDKIYVGQQFIYTSKLYIADNTEMQTGNLTNPKAENAVIKQVGKDTSGSEIINGRRFQTITRSYAITLNKAGYTRIIPSRFEGKVSTYRPGYRFANRKPVVIQGKAHNVNVLAIPDNFKGEWLASDFVQLIEEWQPDQQDYYAQGEPVTRTITLTAANIDKTALPDITVNWPENVKVYPDKPQLSQFVQQGRYFAQQVMSYAAIPNQAGKVVFPEVSVSWFNTQTGRTEVATLPAKTIIVQANAELPTPVVNSQPTATATTSSPQATSTLWQWLTLLFAVLWLLTLAAWMVTYKRMTHRKTIADSNAVIKEQNSSVTETWKQLSNALKANDAKHSQVYLQQWFKLRWPEQNSHSLTDLPITEECRAACNALASHLFAAEQTTWQGAELLALLTAVNDSHKSAASTKQSSIVQNLNP